MEVGQAKREGARLVEEKLRLLRELAERRARERSAVMTNSNEQIEPDEGLVKRVALALKSMVAFPENENITGPLGEFVKNTWIGKYAEKLFMDAARVSIVEAAPSIRAQALEEAAKVAEWAHMVPPDGGSPSAAEYEVAKNAAAAIRSLAREK